MDKPTPTNTKKPATKAETIFGFVILAVIVLAIIWVLSSLFSDHGSSNNSTDTKSAAPTTTVPTPTKNSQQKVTDWFNNYGYVIGLYTPDFSAINKDAGNSDIPAVAKDCQKLSDDVAKAQAVPAIPDAQSASDFSSALTYYQTGATQCVTAANNNDNQGLIDAAGVLTKGTDKIRTTTADITAAEQ
jgi:hypothetical protein